jgi:hypothetical protein
LFQKTKKKKKEEEEEEEDIVRKTRHHILLPSEEISKLNIRPHTLQALLGHRTVKITEIMVLKKTNKKSYLTKHLLTF